MSRSCTAAYILIGTVPDPTLSEPFQRARAAMKKLQQFNGLKRLRHVWVHCDETKSESSQPTENVLAYQPIVQTWNETVIQAICKQSIPSRLLLNVLIVLISVCSVEKCAQPPVTAGMTEFAKSLCFDLPYALTGDTEGLADFFKRALGAVLQSKPHLDDTLFARRECVQHFLRHFL